MLTKELFKHENEIRSIIEQLLNPNNEGIVRIYFNELLGSIEYKDIGHMVRMSDHCDERGCIEILSFDTKEIFENFCTQHDLPHYYANFPYDLCDIYQSLILFDTYDGTDNIVDALWDICVNGSQKNQSKP